MQEPPGKDTQCTRPDEASCFRNCCPEGKPLTEFDEETLGCKAWLGSEPATKCEKGISDKKPDPVSPLE
jgi:hypothetical protein